MNALGVFVLTCVVGFPIAWGISEFKAGRTTRMTLGVVSILLSFSVAWLVGSLQRMNYNTWYGTAAESLVSEVVLRLESGEKDKVLSALKEFQSSYAPTYENRAHFDKLAERAVSQMKK
jgi:hypothetical protein